MRTDCLKGSELLVSTNIFVTDEGIELKILGTEDTKIELSRIPQIKNDIEKIYYMQTGTCIYIALEDEENDMTFIYIIEQALKNERIIVKNLYSSTIVGEKNILAKFFRYDKEFEINNITERLIKTIDKIDVIFEKEYLKGKIIEYMQQGSEQLKTEPLIKTKIEPLKSDYAKPRIMNKPWEKRCKAIEYNGKTYTSISEFCREFNVPYSSFSILRDSGMSLDEMVQKYSTKTREEKVKRNGLKGNNRYTFEYDGKTFIGIPELSRYLDIPLVTVTRKIKQGKSIEQIVEENKLNKMRN